MIKCVTRTLITVTAVALMLSGCGSGGGTNSAVVSSAAEQVTPETSTSVAKQLIMAWDPVVGATSYNLYWSTVPGVTPANGTKISGVSTPYTHTGLAAGTTYYYVVTAVDSSSESLASSPASGTTPL
ncbi:MAG: fibronectin type III domain-containing protein [Desulfuromonadaceae bacterium]